MPVMTATQATVHDFDGSRWSAYVSPSRGSQQLCAWRAEIPVEATPSAHYVNKEEVLFVLKGRLRLEHGQVDQVAEAGDALVVPADTQVRISNVGDESATTWVTTSVGFVGTMPDGSQFVPPWVR